MKIDRELNKIQFHIKIRTQNKSEYFFLDK